MPIVFPAMPPVYQERLSTHPTMPAAPTLFVPDAIRLVQPQNRLALALPEPEINSTGAGIVWAGSMTFPLFLLYTVQHGN